MFQKSQALLINYMRLHNRKTARQYSAEYGKVWTKEIIPRTEQDVQLYGWFHNYPFHNQNDLTWWADRRRPRHTIANYALKSSKCSIFVSLLRLHEDSVIHQLSLGGGRTLLLPIDEAFASVEAEALSKLKRNSRACQAFLLNHVVSGEMSVRDLASRCKQIKSGTVGVKSVNGNIMAVRVVGSLENANREILFSSNSKPPARVVNHGIRCSNGVVFVIDGLV